MANRSVDESAKAGDQSALRAAERRLDRAARKARRARRHAAVAAADPITRLLATFPYKEAPLFVQQTTRAEGDNVRLFASVLQDQFCLKSRRLRAAAVQSLVRHIDESLRGPGSEELELIVVPVKATAPVAADAFAIAREGTAKLTRKGRRC